MGVITDYIKRLFGSGGKADDSAAYAQTQVSLQELLHEHKVPGMALTVLEKGETILQRGFGLADIDLGIPVDPKTTLFRIASASKPIASMALAKMVSENKIELDRSFYHYVPYFPKKEFDFTIRQLAAHTAGIRGYRGKEYALNKPYSIKESIKLFQDDPLLFRPGTDFLYTSFDWVLLSLAMEEISGIPFSEYVKQNVLLPLGMDNTLVEIPEESLKHKAVSYSRTRTGFRPAIPVDNRYKLAGGGYLSTSDDLAKLGRACLENTLVPPQVMKEFLTPQIVNKNSTYYGLGWQVSRDSGGRPFIGHVGNGVGGYSNFFVYPEDEVVISLLINCTDPKIQPLLDEKILPSLLEEISANGFISSSS